MSDDDSGNDLREQGVDAMARVRRMHALILRLQEFPKVIVSAVKGLALGGGLELAMASTFRTGHSGAQFGLPETKMNLIPGFGGTQLLPRLIGEQRALDMLLSGESIDADTAFRLGLIDAVDDVDPVDAAVRLLKRYSGAGLDTQRAVRSAVRNGMGRPLAEGLDIERGFVAAISGRGASVSEAFGRGHRF